MGNNITFTLRAPLKLYGRKIRSQNDEDGIIAAIFADIPPRSRYFVEFGVGPNWLDSAYVNGLEGNCVHLREQGWAGLFMDGNTHPDKYEIRKEFVTALNINSLLRRYNVPSDVDVISIDVDGQDFWIWMALDYHPTLIIIEMNSNFKSLEERKVVSFDPNFSWDGRKYYGASLGALVSLGRDKGYKLVYANGINAFFVRELVLANPDDFKDEDLSVHLDIHRVDDLDRPWLAV